MGFRRLQRWIAAGALLALVLAGGRAGSLADAARNITTGSISAPTWSPDGRSIAWSQLVPGVGGQIWIAKRDMSGAHPVTRAIDALGTIAWLPHQRLVYEADFRIFVLDLETKKTSLISGAAGDTFVVDRRGDRIATGDPPCSTGCYGPVLVLNPQGRVVGKVGGRTQNMSPSFSPRGRRIAFDRNLCAKTGRCDTPAGIWTASVATHALRRVTKTGRCADWSPDGRSIAYIDGFPGSLRVVGADGGASATLVQGIGSCSVGAPPLWSPDSRNVAAVNETTGALQVVDARTQRVKLVTALTIGTVFGFAWSPNASQLLVAGLHGPRWCADLWLVSVKTAAARRLRSCG